MLYVIATPIGNLEDLSYRAAKILKEVKLVLAEDTRVTKKLLSYVGSKAKLESLHEHTGFVKLQKIINELSQGLLAALVTDAGTPGISDPGAKFIDMIYKQDPKIKIIPIPGPSAVTLALSVCGFRAEKFCFWGYPPKKKGRKKFFKRIVQNSLTQVFFSTPQKIIKDLLELKEAGIGERQIFVAREMTKRFESYYRGHIDNVLEQIKKDPQKGEYTIVVNSNFKFKNKS